MDISAHRSERGRRRWVLGAVLLGLLASTAVWRLALGEWDIPLSRVAALLRPGLPEAERTLPEALIVRTVRLPRLLAAVGTGGLLAVSGAVLQGLLSNPLAEPYTLGIAAGAAFGGACALIFDSPLVTPMAFAGAVAALWLVGLIAWRSGGGGAHLVLAGVIANAVLSAGVTFLKAVADDRLGAIVLWLMGSFSGAGPEGAAAVWAAAALVLLPAWACGPMLDAVSLGEGRGAMLGVDEVKLRRLLLCAAPHPPDGRPRPSAPVAALLPGGGDPAGRCGRVRPADGRAAGWCAHRADRRALFLLAPDAARGAVTRWRSRPSGSGT